MTSVNNTAIAAVDLGNSKVKLLLDGNNISFDYKDNWLEKLIKTLLQNKNAEVVVGVSSVRPEKLKDLIKYCGIYTTIKIVNPVDAVAHITNGIQIVAHGAGADRLLGLYGALLYSPPPFFTIDCGTAITVNFVDSEGVFRGGAILPGIGSQLRALHEFTEQLPLLDATSPAAYIGGATETAMMAGVVGGAGGAVRRLIEKMWCEAEGMGTPVVIVTGGEADVLLPELSDWAFPVQHRQNLVREGVLYATQRSLEQKHG